MTRFDLRRMVRKPRRRAITLRPIIPPAMFASDLYAAVYQPAIALWQRYGQAILNEYERMLSAITTDAPEQLTGQMDQAEAELQRLVLLLRPAMRSWALKLESWHRGKWKGAILTATNVDLGTFLDPSDVGDTLETAIERNVGLVKDVSAQARQRISTAVFDGLRERRPARDVAKAINEATGLARDRSKRIASDQLTKTASRLAQARAEQAGFDQYVWMHSQKLYPRENHKARDGKVYDWAKPPADGHPGTQPYCGCTARAHMTFDDD